jgi:alpha-glucosidase
LVAPFESTDQYGKVYLPQGTWYDLYNGSVEKGNQEKVVPLTLSKLPVYVKGGSIIPMQSLIQTTAEQPTDTLAIHVYNGSTANSIVYYEDDGKSFNYQKGDFYKRAISFNPQQHTIEFNAAEGSYTSHFKYIKLILHGFDNTTALTSNKQQVKLQNGTYMFLNAASTDVHDHFYATDTCAVKYATISNASGSIQLKY